MKRFWRKRRVRSLPQMGELPLTSLIDTAFTLLIIFMVTAPMMQNSLKIDLPKTNGAKTNSMDTIERLIVSIDATGKVFVGEQAMLGLPELNKYLESKIATTTDKTVLVKADKTLVYDKVIQVIDQVSGVNGVQSVALAAELTAKRV